MNDELTENIILYIKSTYRDNTVTKDVMATITLK